MIRKVPSGTFFLSIGFGFLFFNKNMCHASFHHLGALFPNDTFIDGWLLYCNWPAVLPQRNDKIPPTAVTIIFPISINH